MSSLLATCIRNVDEVKCNICNMKAVKNGRSANGIQRYKCKSCNKTFQLIFKYEACRVNTDYWITKLIKEGCGIRSISRLLKIAIATVIKRTKLIASGIKKPSIVFCKKYQLDEIRTFVKRKDNLVWIAYALCKDTKEVVDFCIGKRTNKTLKTVVNTLILSEAKIISTDHLKNYKYLIPHKIHSTKIYGINHIERMNLNIRTHLKRLSRRTICFSRSTEMLSACLKIYFWG